MAETCTGCRQWITGSWEEHQDVCPANLDVELSVEDEFEQDTRFYGLDNDEKERIWNEHYREKAFDQHVRWTR